MVANASSQFTADISRYLDDEVLPLAQKVLVVYQFAKKVKLPEGRGVTWTGTRYNRIPLPIAPLSEGVPPIGEQLTLSQVTGVVQQWGDKVAIPDVGEMVIQHPLVEQATRLLGYQVAETLERNAFNALMSAVQVNYVNQRGSRAAIVAGDVLDPVTVNRTVADLKNLGARMMNGPQETEVRRQIEHGAQVQGANPRSHEHYVSISSPLVLSDFAQNPTVVTAWSYSQIDMLYVNEAGFWRGMHFCESNMTPFWVGIASPGNGTAGTSGNLPGSPTTYFIQITGSNLITQYETQIYQVSAGVSVTGPNGSIAITMPSNANFTYSVYIGTTSSPANLALTTSGPTTGPYAGQAVAIPASTAVVLTGIGLPQTPPAAPATGVTVYPTFVFGEEFFQCIELRKVEWTRLFEADKSDPLNQLRIVGWKMMQGWMICNQLFGARIESTVSNTGAFG